MWIACQVDNIQNLIDMFLFLFFFRENVLKFHVNHLLADDSHEMSHFIFAEQLK